MPKLHAVIDPETARADKLLTYFRHFNIQFRYRITFREFVAKVDNGTWIPYLAGE